MLIPEDEQMLCKILGVSALDADVVDEYQKRRKMYDRAGQSGPLGAVSLIDLLRHINKVAPGESKSAQQVVEWETLPQDGRTRVEARFFGGWVSGTFQGFVEHGTLAIRLDTDDYIRECRRDMVRLVKVLDEKPEPVKSETPPPPPAPLVFNPSTGQLSDIDQDGDDSDYDGDDPDTADWNTLPEGSPVQFKLAGDICFGAYVKPCKGGNKLQILYNGTKRNIDAENVKVMQGA